MMVGSKKTSIREKKTNAYTTHKGYLCSFSSFLVVEKRDPNHSQHSNHYKYRVSFFELSTCKN